MKRGKGVGFRIPLRAAHPSLEPPQHLLRDERHAGVVEVIAAVPRELVA